MSIPGERLFALIIMDGWGLSDEGSGNAVRLARTPNMDYYNRMYPCSRLAASGEDVGLPHGQMGNSEVGHLNLGAGRIVYQEILRISRAIEDKSFFANDSLLTAMKMVKESASSLHLMGLLSDGGVHSHNTHLYALLRLAKTWGLPNVFVHAVLDGRDTPPSSAAKYLEELEKEMAALGTGKTASLAGRYWTMDRDNRWERVEKAYLAYTGGQGRRAADSLAGLKMAYDNGETDEFVIPTVILDGNDSAPALIGPGDAVIFFNFRADRARQITKAFTETQFEGFDRGKNPPFPYFVTLTEYDQHLQTAVAFPPEYLNETLGEAAADAGLSQLRIAETEKYAHVTYFFSGGVEEIFSGEKRILIPSPKVQTYDLKPEMSAVEVTAETLKVLKKGDTNLIILNYANTDMVGHTGKLDKAMSAVETVDHEVGAVVAEVLKRKGGVIITSDHGNAEKMIAEDGSPHTAHTTNDVPFILITPSGDYNLPPRGKLSDVAPTILQLLQIPIPPKMAGASLI